MSLINDALKRAKEAQRQAPPPSSPQMQFRPVEPSQHPRHGLSLIVPAALAAVALLVLLFVWQWAQRRTAQGPQEVRALTPPAAQATIAPQLATPPPVLVAAAAEPSPPAEPSPRPDAVTEVANLLPVTSPTTPAGPPLGQEQESNDAPSASIAPPPVPKSPPLRLQGIVFNPRRPCVVINGRTLFVGEKLGDARVVAIDRESATLVSTGGTNVLTMSE
jgi:hypothetical protein